MFSSIKHENRNLNGISGRCTNYKTYTKFQLNSEIRSDILFLFILCLRECVYMNPSSLDGMFLFRCN